MPTVKVDLILTRIMIEKKFLDARIEYEKRLDDLDALLDEFVVYADIALATTHPDLWKALEMIETARMGELLRRAGITREWSGSLESGYRVRWAGDADGTVITQRSEIHSCGSCLVEALHWPGETYEIEHLEGCPYRGGVRP